MDGDAAGEGGGRTLQPRRPHGSGAALTVSDVLVGDVFLCSGQSNMELGVGQSRGGEFVAARSANDRIRLLNIAHAAKSQPATSLATAPAWQSAGPTVCAVLGGLLLLRSRGARGTEVPVGLVNAAWGGTAIEPWIGESGLRSVGGFDARLDLLRLYARDEDAANQGLGRMWEDWWRGHDAAAGEPWKPEDSGPWTDVPELRNWKTWGVPELTSHDGMGGTAARSACPVPRPRGRPRCRSAR